LKRFSPAAICLIVVASFVILADAVIVVVPAALADPRPSASAPPSIAAGLTVTAAATPTVFADPTAVPTPAPSMPDWSTYAQVDRPSPGPSQPAAPTIQPTPAPYRDTVWNARTYVKNRVGAKGYDCLNAVWTAESKWNPRAGSPTGAYGIPQAFPGSKMAAFGSNWRYSPLTQVKWGLWYATSRYGSACGAYDFWKVHAWY
jgi:hypothetical protein